MSGPPCLCGGTSDCELPGPPGQAALWSDRSGEFLRDPAEFVERECEQHGVRVFLARIFFKQTLVIAEHRLLTVFLNTCMDDFENGLKDNFSDLFGHNIMFAGAEEAQMMRKMMLPLFGRDDIGGYQTLLGDILTRWSNTLDVGKSINLYEEIKSVSLAYNLEVFMGVKRADEEEFFQEVSKLATTHWHGVTSLPFNVSIPFLGSGGFKKAMQAKKKLLRIIQERVEGRGSPFSNGLENNNSDKLIDDESLYNHILLFSCALIPKGVGAIVGMFLELGEKWQRLLDKNGNLSDDNLECILLETIRMYPPFSGGVKVAVKDTKVGDYHIPRGTAIYYNLQAAMRDPAAFLHPEMFMPSRWARGEDRHTNLAFSVGPHDCIGRHFSWTCLKSIISFILRQFNITFPSLGEAGQPQVKQLPVLRPKTPHMFSICRKY